METVSLSVVVMAHPSRERHFSFLREKLGEDTPFSIDMNNNLLENAKAAWRMHDMTKDFAVTVQDDAVPVDNFRERAAAFITEQEERRIQAGRPEQGYNFFLKQDNHLTPLWPKDGAYHDNVTRAVRVDQHTLDGHFIKTWPSIKEAAQMTGVCYGTIRANMNGQRRTGKGFIWKRTEKSYV